MTDYTPIRKLVAVFVGAAVLRLAQHLGVDVGDDLANDAAVVLGGLALGYVVRDPRVVS